MRRLGSLVGALALMPIGAAALAETPPHSDPACWSAPRLYHAGPVPAELAERIHLIEAPAAPPSASMPSEPVVSPNGAYRFWVRNPDTSQPPPWGAGVIVDHEQPTHRVLLVENEKLIFTRLAWGRVRFSDLILDVETGEIVLHELVRDGTIAMQQFRQACEGPCPCGSPPAAPAASESGASGAPATTDASTVMPAATPGEDAVIGLVQLPTIFAPPEQGGVGPAADPVPVPVYDAPTGGARKLAELVDIAAFEYREYTYEGAAAVVYETQPGWYRIGVRAALPTGAATAWISAKSAGAFLGLADLLPGRLAYLNQDWDGFLWTKPEDGMRMGLSRLKRDRPDGDEYAANIEEVREIDGGVWLKVETLSGRCEAGTPTVVDRGWVPAYSHGGSLTVWFHSRGC